MIPVIFGVLAYTSLEAQVYQTKKIVLVTLDGFRWQELFRGADTRLLSRRRFVKDAVVVTRYSGATPRERRQKLMPFVWETIARQGQLYGHRAEGNKVNVSNRYRISYPGYYEMLTGFANPSVASNERIDNRGITVFDAVSNAMPRKTVAVFSGWDMFDAILGRGNSSLHVDCPLPGGHASDSVVFGRAFDYLRKERPDVLMISLMETDAAGHARRYDAYLLAAADADRWLATLWRWLQEDPEYRGRTTLLITTDHGRGSVRPFWKNHGRFTPGAGQVWFMAIGPDTPALGEMRNGSRLVLSQMAATIAAFLNVPYIHPRGVVAPPVHTMFLPPPLQGIDMAME